MANTRNRVTANNAENNGENNNQDANPPPSPPHTLEQVLAMQAQMLQTMQQTMVNLHAQPQAPPPLRDRLGDFQRTKSPIFSYVVEPMDADDWLKFVEKKLQVMKCNNCEKVLLASHQLSGPTADGGMLTWKPMRNLRASTSRSSEPLFMHIMFPKELSS
jgi:hypothetical protein